MKCVISAKSFYKLQQDFKVQDKASPLWAGGPVDPAVHMLSKWMEKPLLAYSVDELKHSINAECWLTKLNSSKEENLQLPFLSVEKSVFPSRAFLKTFKLKLMRLKCHQLITNWVSRARHTAAFRTDVWNSGLLSQKHLSAVSCGLILSFFFPLCSLMMNQPSFELLLWHQCYWREHLKGRWGLLRRKSCSVFHSCKNIYSKQNLLLS